MNPSCSFAASLIRDGSQGGSNTSSTSASFTPGTPSTRRRTSSTMTGPMPQPGRGERHDDLDAVPALDRLGGDEVDEPQLDDARRDLRVVHLPQASQTFSSSNGPSAAAARSASNRRASSTKSGPSASASFPSTRTRPPVAVIAVNGAAERLLDDDGRPGRQRRVEAARHLHDLDVPEGAHRLRVPWLTPSRRARPAPRARRGARARRGSRTSRASGSRGRRRTRRASRAPPRRPARGPSVTSRWNCSKSASISSRRLPLHDAGHHRGRRLRDGAARPLEAGLAAAPRPRASPRR